MRSSDLRREENYNEYLRLLQDGDYVEVAFDEESGGMSAVHTQHKFSRQLGPYGIRRGDYERIVMKVLRDHGHRIILASEKNTPGLGQSVRKCVARKNKMRNVWSCFSRKNPYTLHPGFAKVCACFNPT